MFISKIYYSPKANPKNPYCLHIIHVDEDGNEAGIFPTMRHNYETLEEAKYIPGLFKYPVKCIRC